MSGNGPMTGKVFSSRYEIGERIGIGGMAEVYSAQDNVLGRVVAVKVMLPQYANDADFARRFRQEAAAAANLQSPYIVNVYDWGHDDDTYYIVMEYVRGSDLKTAIEQRGAINQRKVAEIGAQVCQALTVAHAQDIIHRDVKPQNIMVQPDGNVKVMDFGIARAKNSTNDKTQTVLGTAHYISPEQAQGLDLTASSDIYSLGVVLYEAATGTLPFDGPDAVSVALMQVKDFPLAPREINPDIDPAFEQIIMTAMEKEPGRRFATANDMRLALNDYLAGRTSAAAGAAGFTQAQTSVIAPIGAAAGKTDATQVMPVTAVNAGGRPSSGGRSGGGSGTYRAGGANGKGGKKKNTPMIVGAVIAVVAIIVVAFAAYSFLSKATEEVDVPSVENMTVAQAYETIEAAGLKVGKTDETYDTSVESGLVISQNPKGGAKASKGSKIDLVISQGTEKVRVPDVTGKSLSQATQILTRDGFIVGETTEQSSENVPQGKVVSQAPEQGQEAPKGSSVDLVLSSGPDTVDVPTIEGLSLDAARAKAESAGFTIAQSGTAYSDTISANCIISQTPAPNSKAGKGTTINYVLSLGSENTAIPNVKGYTEEGATSALQDAGFVVSVRTVASPGDTPGNVISQTPDAGTKAAKGTTVTITVAESTSGGSGNSGSDPSYDE